MSCVTAQPIYKIASLGKFSNESTGWCLGPVESILSFFADNPRDAETTDVQECGIEVSGVGTFCQEPGSGASRYFNWNRSRSRDACRGSELAPESCKSSRNLHRNLEPEPELEPLKPSYFLGARAGSRDIFPEPEPSGH